MQTHGRDIIVGTLIVMLLAGLAVILPIIGSFTVFFIPLPIIYYRVKAGQKAGLAITAASMVIVLLLARGLQFELIILIQLFVMGLVQGEGLARRSPLTGTCLIAVAVTAAVTLLWVLLFSLLEGVTPAQLIKNFVANIFATIYQMLDESMLVYQQRGLNTQGVEALKYSLGIWETRLVTLGIGYTLMSFICTAWANLVVTRYIFIRKGLSWTYGSLNEWRAPAALVYAGIFGALLTLFTPGSLAFFAGIQIVLVCMTVYCLQGIAVISFMMTRRKMNTGLQVVVYVIIAIIPMMIMAVAILGILDIVLDFRSKNFGKTEAKPNFN